MIVSLQPRGTTVTDLASAVWAILPERLAMIPAAIVTPQSAARSPSATRMDRVAVIPITGVLVKGASWLGGTSTLQARRDLREAVVDPNVSAILLSVESPGGIVAGLDDLAADVRAARKQKPVWAHVDDLCASAAYWIASQVEKVYANSPTALVGSIGTILTLYDLSRAAEKQGVKAHVFSTGPLKGAGVEGTEITPQQQNYFQKIVNGLQMHFDDAVRRGRGFSKTQLDAVKSGGAWKADEAQDLGLIDGVQPLEKTLRMLGAAGEQQQTTHGALPMLHTGRLPMISDRFSNN